LDHRLVRRPRDFANATRSDNTSCDNAAACGDTTRNTSSCNEVMKVPRGEYRSERVDQPAADEREHFECCPACGGWIDLRNLGQVLDHAGPLPHPPEDQPQ
jgi:hypothetical protein